MASSIDTEISIINEADYMGILTNDTTLDGTFFYAVKTTGIFCRPSCKSKAPNRTNIRLFTTAQEALEENYRPCKRCKPTDSRLPNEEWIHQVTTYIDQHFADALTLEHLAQVSHGSPYHLHRTFLIIMKVTPMEYVQKTRIAGAKRLLVQSKFSVSIIGQLVGLRNTPYFITLFKKRTGLTPQMYRQTFES